MLNLLLSNLPSSYFDYVQKLLEHNLFTYDITPGYSALSQNTLKFIKKSFEDRKIDRII